MKCERCHRDLESDAPVYRIQLGAITNWCTDCAALLTGALEWRQPKSCEGCGRPVIYQANRRRRQHTICGQHSCRLAVRAAEARARARPLRVCQSCGERFVLKRLDAQYCSAACKQRAYRRRIAA